MILWAVVAYLVVGLLFLIVFQLTTHRISQRLHDVSVDVMMKLANSGAGVVTRGIAVGITLVYAWLFWVVVLFGYLSDRSKVEK